MEFSKFISELDDGRTHERLSEELAEVIEAVNETGQKGELTVKLTVRKEGMQAKVDADSTPKLPKHPHHGTLFFFSKQPGRLSRKDERQLELNTLAAREIKEPTP